MSSTVNMVLGGLFLLLAVGNTLLMFRLWAYPFDHTTHRSSAPRPLMWLHRGIGYAYVAIYILLMTEMVPRLWEFQVELPARTVAHVVLGMTVGVLLLVKIAIVRFFKHLESALVPMLGTGILVCTVLLLGLSVPFQLREVALSREVSFDARSTQRVQDLLGVAGLPEEASPIQLATPEGLRTGRQVLLNECTRCHDLRTVLVRPRTPATWYATVSRMADRAALLDPIPRADQWAVVAYLIAISPDLQRSVVQQTRLQEAPAAVAPAAPSDLPDFSPAEARTVFELTCNQCHEITAVEEVAPASEVEIRELVTRMVDNGLRTSETRLEMIVSHLVATYVAGR